MFSANHPQTDGSSEQINKNQCLHFHVECNQKGWSRALPQICFALINTTNKSMGYSPFQLKYRHSPRVLPDFGAVKTGDREDVMHRV